MELYDNFSDKSKLILEQAFTEVGAMNMNYVGSEHLLLSMLKIKAEVLDEVKRYNRLTYKDVKKECLRYVGIGLVQREIQGYSRRASEILKLASFEANSLKSIKVEPVHIFLALLDQSESTAVKILEKIGFSAFDLKTDIIRELDIKDKKSIKEKKEQIESSFLEKFGIDMTELAKSNKYDPVLERDEETKRIIQILGRRSKNNPCLIGEPGVGKTAIVEGVANLMVSSDAPDYLMNKKLYTISLGSLLAGSKFRGEFEDRLTQLINEVRRKKNVILFIDEIHTLVGAGATQGAMDAANILKPFLSRDDIQIIGATTIGEYRRYIEKDVALERRLQPVMVKEPSEATCLNILKGIRKGYESYHNIIITDEVLETAIKLSSKYISDRYLPDKAIDLIDEAASRTRLEKVEILDVETIYEVIALWTGIPMYRLNVEDKSIQSLSDYLNKKIKGQAVAVETVTKAIMRSRVGLSDENKPLGTFMFMGQTGVGKTAFAKSLAEQLFGRERDLIRIDMSEYMEKHSVSKLIGSPPGYVAYEDGGQLTEKVRTNPFSVVLFDELEKAHPDVINILLQLLDEGVLTDSKGRAVSFKHTIVIFTSNIGTELINTKAIGFSTNKEFISLEVTLKEQLKKMYSPEFLNRIDEIVVFKKLETDDVYEIIQELLSELKDRVVDLGYDISFDHSVKEKIFELGYSDVYGVRSLKRAVTKVVENPLAEFLVASRNSKKDSLMITIQNDETTILSESVRKA